MCDHCGLREGRKGTFLAPLSRSFTVCFGPELKLWESSPGKEDVESGVLTLGSKNTESSENQCHWLQRYNTSPLATFSCSLAFLHEITSNSVPGHNRWWDSLLEMEVVFPGFWCTDSFLSPCTQEHNSPAAQLWTTKSWGTKQAVRHAWLWAVECVLRGVSTVGTKGHDSWDVRSHHWHNFHLECGELNLRR